MKHKPEGEQPQDGKRRNAGERDDERRKEEGRAEEKGQQRLGFWQEVQQTAYGKTEKTGMERKEKKDLRESRRTKGWVG